MIKRALYIIAIATISSCCTKKNGTATHGNKPAEIMHSTTATDKETTAESNTFWSELFVKVCESSTKENICISPLSAQLAMAMVANGAEGETKEEICNVMQFGNDFNSHSKKLMDTPESHSCKFEIANSIWINEKLDVKKPFVVTNREYFDALVERIKFDDSAVSRINGWCNEKTNGKIPNIIEKVKKNDMMYLLNAIYFKAKWNKPFTEQNTTKQKFTTEKGEEVEVDMMMQRSTSTYYSNDLFTMTTKSYNGGYSMLLVLPKEGVNCSEAAKHLANNLDTYIGEMERCDVLLSLPKFKTNFFTSLKPMLTDLGIERAFGNGAQFGGISDKPLLISDVMQKTFISVDEEGTEAAAVTSVAVGLMSAGRPDRIEIMKLDRPFIYAIIDNSNNEVLFAGKVGDPTKK